MEEQNFRGCILTTADKIQTLRESCEKFGVPEYIQDGYEDIIDKLICLLGVTQKQRELFWTLTDPE